MTSTIASWLQLAKRRTDLAVAADLDLGLQVEEVQAARRAGVVVAVRDLAHPTLLPASHARLHAWRTPI